MLKKYLSMIICLSLVASTALITFADNETLTADDIAYNNAVEKVAKDNSLSGDIKQLILTELNAKHRKSNMNTFKNNTISSNLKSSLLASDGYEYRYTNTYQVKDFQKFSNRLNFWAAGTALASARKGNLTLATISGVLWVYSSALTIKYEDFTSDTILKEAIYWKWIDQSTYEYSIKLLRSYWCQGTILDAFDGNYYDTVYLESGFID